jgi:hypothetical protein
MSTHEQANSSTSSMSARSAARGESIDASLSAYVRSPGSSGSVIVFRTR